MAPLPQTDLELWCSGQLTISEQLRRQASRERGFVACCCTWWRAADLAPAHWLEDEEEEETTHISFRLLSLGSESEFVDIAMTFPLRSEDVLSYVLNSARVVSEDWLNAAAFTQPQVADNFGSVVILPGWLRASNKTILVLDAMSNGQGLYAFYRQGEVNRSAIL